MKIKKRGFTLLELMAVVIIIAILAAIGAVQIIGAMEKTRISEAVSVLGDLARSQYRYYILNGKTADDIDDLDCAYTEPEYFNSPVALNGNITANEPLGRMVRNNKSNTIYGNYSFEVSADRILTCDPNGGKCPPGY